MLLKIHLILLLLLILASIPLSSSSYINFTALNADGSSIGSDVERSESLTCGSVPYPFGTVSNALPGFEIGCPKDPLIPPILSISKNTYTIQEISLQGYINIFARPIHKRCFDGENWTESEGSGRFNLDGTRFALSYQYNMLTVVGCNNLVLISGQGENLTATNGFVTFCDPQPQGTFLSGSCSGLVPYFSLQEMISNQGGFSFKTAILMIQTSTARTSYNWIGQSETSHVKILGTTLVPSHARIIVTAKSLCQRWLH